MKTYTIHVNSSESIASTALGVDKTYNFDFGIMPEGEYELTFTFQGQLEKLTTADGLLETYPTKIFCRLPFIQNKYEVTQEGVAGSSHLLGLLEPKDGLVGSSAVMRSLVAGAGHNAPTYLYGKPQGSTFNVIFANANAIQGSPNPVPTFYDLVLNFKHLC
tara:strand:- start:1515 stop:1997 length:483 start_codon:yes stop_codon:yes gene_type:complete